MATFTHDIPYKPHGHPQLIKTQDQEIHMRDRSENDPSIWNPSNPVYRHANKSSFVAFWAGYHGCPPSPNAFPVDGRCSGRQPPVFFTSSASASCGGWGGGAALWLAGRAGRSRLVLRGALSTEEGFYSADWVTLGRRRGQGEWAGSRRPNAIWCPLHFTLSQHQRRAHFYYGSCRLISVLRLHLSYIQDIIRRLPLVVALLYSRRKGWEKVSCLYVRECFIMLIQLTLDLCTHQHGISIWWERHLVNILSGNTLKTALVSQVIVFRLCSVVYPYQEPCSET